VLEIFTKSASKIPYIKFVTGRNTKQDEDNEGKLQPAAVGKKFEFFYS